MSTPKKEKEYIIKSFIAAEHNCEVPWVLNYGNPLPGTGLKLHQILTIVGGCLGLVNIVIALYLLVGHLRYWTKPREQKQYIRIIFFVIFLTLTTFFSLMFYDAAVFIQPLGQYYEGFAIIALYLLYMETIVSENSALSYTSFGDVKDTVAHSHSRYGAGGKSLGWLRRSWIFVFQVAMTRVITLIAAEAVAGSNCPLSKEARYGKTAVEVFQSVSTGFAITGVIVLETRLGKELLHSQKSFFKLVSFKGVVGLQATQEIIFPILAQKGVFFPTYPYYVSYNDFALGLPALLFIFELTITVTMFLWTFNSNRYRELFENGESIKAGPFYAFMSIFGLLDIFQGLISGIKGDDGSYVNGDGVAEDATASDKLGKHEESA